MRTTEPFDLAPARRQPNLDDCTAQTSHALDVMGDDPVGAARVNNVEGLLDGVPVHIISKEHPIANKNAVGRPEDLADVARLR